MLDAPVSFFSPFIEDCEANYGVANGTSLTLR